jgi:outer membrane receptor protein involved in Fe transport
MESQFKDNMTFSGRSKPFSRLKNGLSTSFLSCFAISVLLVFVSIHSSGQSCISGKIISAETGKPVPDANITVTGITGTISDQDGAFRLCNLPSDSTTIKVSFMGYQAFQYKTKLNPGGNNLPAFSIIPIAINIDEFVITATRTDNRVVNTPVRVNQISPKMLKNIPMENIDEAMKYSPGINYSRPFGIYSTKAIITMRGMSGKEQGRVLVLLDGVPINKSDGGTVDWNMIDINSVQKIEITKGAGSAVYGGNAMGGTINIISKVPEAKRFVQASVEYGTYNTFGGKLNSGGQIKIKKSLNSLYWLANVYAKQSDGYITQSQADVNANPYIVKSDMKEAGINFKTGYSIAGKHTIEAMVNYYNDRRGTGEKVYQPEGNITDHDSYGLILNYRGSFEKIKLNSSFYGLTEDYKKVNEYLKDDYTWYDVLSTRRDYGWFTSVTASLGKNQALTGGFDYKNGSVDAYDKYFTSTDIVYNQGKMATYSLFAQDEVNLLQDKIRLLAGLRFDMAKFYEGSFRIENPSMETEFMNEYQVPDMPEQNWNALSPRLSVQYRWNNTDRIYVLYSHGFRPSVLDDLCRSGRIKGGFKIANPSIKPEYLNNYETGFDLKPTSKSNFNASIYYSRGSDFQYYVSNGQTIDMGFGDRPIFIRSNISDVEIYGAEAEIRYDLLASVSVSGNYAYTHSTIISYTKIAENDTIDLSGKFFTDVPAHIFTLGANWNNKYVNTSLYVRYNGSMYINDQNTVDEILLSDKYPAYTTVDLKIWKAFKKHYKLTLNIQNLMDVKYYDSKYAVCPGRFITGEFAVNF